MADLLPAEGFEGRAAIASRTRARALARFTALSRANRRAGAGVVRLLDQAVELPRVLADDLAHGRSGQVAELLLDVLGGLRPHSVAVGIVGAPHQRVLADLVDHLGPDAVELERRLALPPPVVAGLHRETQVAEAVLPLEVHAVEGVGQPADPALSERDPDPGIPLEHRAADHRG